MTDFTAFLIGGCAYLALVLGAFAWNLWCNWHDRYAWFR